MFSFITFMIGGAICVASPVMAIADKPQGLALAVLACGGLIMYAAMYMETLPDRRERRP